MSLRKKYRNFGKIKTNQLGGNHHMVIQVFIMLEDMKSQKNLLYKTGECITH